MIVAGWAWDDRLLMETVSRSAQADMVVLLFAVSCIALLFAVLGLIGGWLDRRALRRDVARAHQPRPLPTTRDLVGVAPDITEGLSAVEHVRRLRSDA